MSTMPAFLLDLLFDDSYQWTLVCLPETYPAHIVEAQQSYSLTSTL